MIIGIDVDETVCDTCQAVLDQHYADTGERLSLNDIKSYYIEDYVGDDYKDDFYLIFFKKEMWKRVKVLPNCVEVIKRLYDKGNEIWFITACDPENVSKKTSFLQRTFPFLDIRNCLITTRCKQLVNVDIMIDDYEKNLVNSNYYGILLDYSWNRNFDEAAYDNIYRVFDWLQVEPMIEYIEKMNKSKSDKEVRNLKWEKKDGEYFLYDKNDNCLIDFAICEQKSTIMYVLHLNNSAGELPIEDVTDIEYAKKKVTDLVVEYCSNIVTFYNNILEDVVSKAL